MPVKDVAHNKRKAFIEPVYTLTQLTEAVARARDEGYGGGHAFGVEEGTAIGKKAGLKAGNAEGFTRGKKEGLAAGYHQGKADGQAETYPGAFYEGTNQGIKQIVTSIEEIWSKADGFEGDRIKWRNSQKIPAWWLVVLSDNLHRPVPPVNQQIAKPKAPPVTEEPDEVEELET